MAFDRRWVVPAFGLVLLQHLIALVVAARLGFDQRPPFYEYGVLYYRALLLIGFVAALVLVGRAVVARSDSPVRHVLLSIKAFAPRLPDVTAGITLCWLQLVALTWYKSMIPLAGPMWADALLADADKMLFGVDLGPALQVAMRPFASLVDQFYILWAPILKLCFVGVLLMPESRNRAISLLSFFLTIGLLGSWGQYLLPSGGPIFWENLGYGDRFSAIEQPPLVAESRDYLWSKYVDHSQGFASGISAFPSIHVATCAWMVIAACLTMPATRIAFAVYFAIIAAGSVYTGWHYGLDGIAGAAGAVGCFFLARTIINLASVRQMRPMDDEPIAAPA